MTNLQWCRETNLFATEALADITGAHDEALVPLFHKRNLRAQMLLGPAGSAMASHAAIQPFGR